MAKIKVVMEPDWELKIQQFPVLKGELTKAANNIAQTANAVSSGFRTEETVNYATGEHLGGKAPIYKAKKAIFTGKHSIALVYTGNYAAAKDNTLHNTLLKSK